MHLRPHLNFDGQCEAAFKFYERCLEGKITFMMTFAESPMASHVPPEWGGKILHASLTVESGEMMHGADAPPGQFEAPKGFAVIIGVADPARAERIFKALSEKATVTMPLQKTFWSPAFGVLVDQFGIPWEINCEQGS